MFYEAFKSDLLVSTFYSEFKPEMWKEKLLLRVTRNFLSLNKAKVAIPNSWYKFNDYEKREPKLASTVRTILNFEKH